MHVQRSFQHHTPAESLDLSTSILRIFFLKVRQASHEGLLANAAVAVPPDDSPEPVTVRFDWKRTFTLFMLDERDLQLARRRNVGRPRRPAPLPSCPPPPGTTLIRMICEADELLERRRGLPPYTPLPEYLREFDRSLARLGAEEERAWREMLGKRNVRLYGASFDEVLDDAFGRKQSPAKKEWEMVKRDRFVAGHGLLSDIFSDESDDDASSESGSDDDAGSESGHDGGAHGQGEAAGDDQGDDADIVDDTSDEY